ncbi:hypothetical protein ACFV0D_15055, partial [Streptomyces sp. NPDC059556]
PHHYAQGGSRRNVRATAEAAARTDGWTPGFVDDRRILFAAAEEPWGEEAAPLLLDGRTLRRSPTSRTRGHRGLSAVPLGDGTWLTHDGETAQRWTTP